MKRPVLLDLFCGAGGAAMGYARAGFEVVGVDIAPQPHFPFEFHQADALTFPLAGFDVIHASPPCQAYSDLAARHRDREYPDLVAQVRARLLDSGAVWVMENVDGAPFLHGITLCGSMFDLRVLRHRRFESSHLIYPPGGCRHRGSVKTGEYVTVCGTGAGKSKNTQPWGSAMGIGWMVKRELSQAIPPAYTEWLGAQLMAVVASRGAA